MSLLQKATVEQSAAKVGIFGLQGSGKTTTLALILIGLSKTYHNGAPVAMIDTENGSDYLVQIFEAEGVELLVIKSRAFRDMCAGLRDAKEAGCCGFGVDSYSHPWMELVGTFKAKSQRKKLEFHHMDQLKGMWRDQWTDPMLNSPLHVVLAGRLGYVWDQQDDGEGGKDLVKLGTKLKSENEAGYEPSLLIEMEAIQGADARMRKTRAKQGTISHHCYVLKDRWRVLNGRTFTFKDMNEYKAGGYLKVFNEFRPHFDRLAIGKVQRSVDAARTSSDLFTSSGESVGAQIARRKQIAGEEIVGILQHLWGGQTALEKKIRQSILLHLFGTFSWTAIEHANVDKLETAVCLLRDFKDAAESRLPDSPESAVSLLKELELVYAGEVPIVPADPTVPVEEEEPVL